MVCFASLGVAFSHVIPNEDAAPAFTNAVFLPLIFISGVFYSADDLPKALLAIAEALPLKHLVDGFSHAMVGGGSDIGERRGDHRRLGARGDLPGGPLLPLGVSRSACPCRRSQRSCSRQRRAA